MKRLFIILALLSQPSFGADHASTFEQVVKQAQSRVTATSPQSQSAFKQFVEEARKELGTKPTPQSLASATAMLVQSMSGLGHYVASDDQVYWLLKSINADQLSARHRHIGAFYEMRGPRWHISDVYEDSPAFKAGLRRGDHVISVNGTPFDPVTAFLGIRPGEKASVAIKRNPWDQPFVIKTATVVESLSESMLRATKRSVHIKQMGSQKIGYLRLWSAWQEEIRPIVKSVTANFESDADAMILDLRSGIGVTVGGLETYFLEGKGQTFSKPLYILVNRFTADDKETLARLLQTHKRAVVVGERPIGAVLAGQKIALAPGESMVFFPEYQSETRLVPDELVKDTLVFTDGHDALLWDALNLAGK